MMLNHMARYVAFKNLSHFTPCKNLFMAFSLYFLTQWALVLTVVQMLRDAGFTDVIAEDRTEQVCVDLCFCMC